MTTMRIIDGRALAERIRAGLASELQRIQTKPGLAVVQVGDNPESTLYVSLKERAAAQVGVRFEKILLAATATQQEVVATIVKLNERPDVHGIVVQLPLPDHLTTSAVLSAVAVEKDVDGLHPATQAAVQHGARTRWLPALPKSILALLDEAHSALRGRSAVVLAASEEFRSTMAALLRRHGARVSTAPSLAAAGEALRNADVVVTTLGAPRTINESALKYGATLIDAGITKLADGGVAGDFAGPDQPSRLAAYSPVPGGVGPVTVATLLQNTAKAHRLATRRSPLALTVAPTTLLWLLPALALAASWVFFGGADYRGRFILFAMFALATAVWLFATPRRFAGRRWQNPDLWFGAFLVIAVIGTLRSAAVRQSLEQAAVLVVALLAFQVGRSLSARQQRRGAAMLVAAGASLALWSIAIWVNDGFVSPRIYGPFKNPDGLGPALLVPLLIGIGVIRGAVQRWQRAVWFFAVAVIAGTLLLTGSVSAFAGLVISAFAAVILFRPPPRRVLTTVAAAAGAVGLMFSLVRLIPPLRTHVTGFFGLNVAGATASFEQRVSFVRSSLAMARDVPVLGVGLGMWSDYFPQYQRSLRERTELAHGILPTVLAELGVPGVVAFFGLLATVFVALWRGDRNDPLLPYAITGLLALAVAGAIDIPWFYPGVTLLFWFVAGAFCNAATVETEPRTERRIRRGLAVVLAVAVLGFGAVRFATSYYAAAADRAAAPGGDFIDALASAELAMALFPTPSEELRMSIVLLTKSWSPTDRQTLTVWADRTLRHNPRQPASYLLRGRLAAAAGDRQRAEELFRSGLELDPHFVPDLAADLAALYLATGRSAEARTLAAAQLERTGLDVPGREQSLATIALLKAHAELALGERDAAMQSLEQALTFQPENDEAKKLQEVEFKIKN